jgi:hypothetical protein
VGKQQRWQVLYSAKIQSVSGDSEEIKRKMKDQRNGLGQESLTVGSVLIVFVKYVGELYAYETLVN